MTAADVLILASVGAGLFFALRSVIGKRRDGCSGCSGCCQTCRGCSDARRKKDDR